MTAGGESGDEHIVRVDQEAFRVFAHIPDRQRGLDQRGIADGVGTDGITQDENIESRGKVLQGDRFRLAVREELITAAGADDHGAAPVNPQFL